MIKIGEFRVDRAVEYEGPFVRPDELFPAYDPSLVDYHRDWLGPVVDSQGELLISFHSFILRTGRHTILIDACMGNDKERPLRKLGHHRHGDFLTRLKGVDVHPDEVDFVMCTHLHWDHVGWNTRLADGTWVPTFPNAQYVIAQREYAHRDAMHARGETSMHDLAFADSVQPLVRAERAVLVKDDFALEDGVWLQPFPGHTPGNVVINIQSSGARGVFSGDVLHSPLQLACPQWSSRACDDVALSAKSRLSFIEQHANTNTVIMPAHFLTPSAGWILQHGDAFRFDPYTP